LALKLILLFFTVNSWVNDQAEIVANARIGNDIESMMSTAAQNFNHSCMYKG